MQTETAQNAPSRLKIIAAFAAVYIIWGSTYVAIKFAIETLPPFLMAGVRFLIAGGILYTWQRLAGAPSPKGREWRAMGIVGALLLVGGNGGVVFAEQFVPSNIAALIVATTPFWMVLIAWLMPGGSRPSLQVMAGLALGLVGIGLLVGPSQFGNTGAINLGGVAILLAGACAWAGGSLYSRTAPQPRSQLMAIGQQMLVGGGLLLTIGTLSGEWGRLNLAQVSWRSGLALLYLIFFGALIGFTAYLWLLKVTTPAQASTYAYVNPAVAVFLGWALAGETLTPWTLIAVVVIIAAVVIITSYRKPAPKVVSETPVEIEAKV